MTLEKYKTVLPGDLIKAYTAAHFHVLSRPAFVLKVGRQSQELRKLFTRVNACNGCFITACNPGSVEISEDENNHAQIKLKWDLLKMNCRILDGTGIDPEGIWVDEPGFFAMDISLEQARKTGKKYQQNAIVWCDGLCVPELIFPG